MLPDRFLRRTVALLLLGAGLAHAQPVPVTSAPSAPTASTADTSTIASQAIRVFLDCQGRTRGCDRDFIVTDIPYVNFMRDRFDSDVQVLVTGLTNGGGGIEMTVAFIGRRKFEGMVDTLIVNTLPNDADDRARRELSRTLKLGLTRFVAKTPQARQLQIGFASPGGRPVQLNSAQLKDRWNLWTYSTNVNGLIRAEALQRNLNGTLSLSANRATNDWKINLAASGNVRNDRFEVQSTGRVVTNEQRTYSANALVVKSLSTHWSAGVKLGASYSDFFNQDLALRAQPAVEYNIFPWTEQTRRQLTFLYNIGPNYYNYQRLTEFNRLTETQFSQQLTTSYIARQPWGSSNVSLDWLNYMHDFRRHALTLRGNADFRIGRGFSLEVGGSVAKVADQIYLPRDGNTPEEVLLQRQALRTGFRITSNVGVRYTFGSIYNTIVNQRFGSLGSSSGRFFFLGF